MSDFTSATDEYPEKGQVIGTINATTTGSNITFTLSEETPVGAIDVNMTSGEITVADSTLFAFADHPKINATVNVTSSDVSKEVTILIVINEPTPVELVVSDFTAAVEEDVSDRQVIGAIEAIPTSNTLTFSIIAMNPVGAIDVDDSTGEITVANPAVFIFEENEEITALIEVSSDGIVKNVNITITIIEPDTKNAVIWMGEKITFTKAGNTDPDAETNQDRLTDHVWITRSENDGGPIFNIKAESFSNNGPYGTKWALGTIDEAESLTFTNLREALGGGKRAFHSIAGKPLVLYLLKDNIYLEVTFNSWSKKQRGSFSYNRSTPN